MNDGRDEREPMNVTTKAATMPKAALTADNYTHSVLVFRDRQAGVSEVYDPGEERFYYNAYCLEKKLMQELYSCEFEFLEDALAHLNDEFGTWTLESFDQKKGCGSCVAK
jgi:hypothetical protein